MCINSLLAQIRTFNEDQLQSLLNDDSRLEAMLMSLPQLTTLNSDRDTRLIMCKSLAESNLQMEPRFKEMRDKLNMTYKEFQLILDEVKQLEAEAKMHEGENSLDTVSALLQAAMQKTEDEGEVSPFFTVDLIISEFQNELISSLFKQANFSCLLNNSMRAHCRSPILSSNFPRSGLSIMQGK